MTVDQTRKYEMFVRVREFGETRGDLFPKSTLAAKAFADIAGTVEKLRQHAVSKMSATRDAARSRAEARAALWGRLVAMNHTARVLARDTAGLEGKFQLPETKGDSSLVTAGRLFADDADAFSAQFVSRAMPKSFIKDLLGLVEALEEAIHGTQAERADRTAARVLIAETVAEGMAAVDAVDAMVTNHLHDDAVGLAVWQAARRIDRRRLGSRRGASRSTNGATATSPAPIAPAPAHASPAPQTGTETAIDQKVA